MKTDIDNRIEDELKNYSNQDVLIYYKRESFNIIWGFYVWNGHTHTQTTFTKFREDGFEKSDIKELRGEAAKFTLIEKSLNEFEVKT